MKQALIDSIKKAAQAVGISADSIQIDYPENPEHGDFTTNIAMAQAKAVKMAPKALAEKIVAELKKPAGSPDFVTSVEIAGPGFINFEVKDEAFAKEIIRVAGYASKLGTDPEKSPPQKRGDAKVMVEYTDPNPFKVFHIGHLMANAVGESIARLTEFGGATVIRANWQGDVGPHVAKALWGAIHSKGNGNGAAFWGQAYIDGAKAYEADQEAKKDIDEINKKIYDRSDEKLNQLYDKGRQDCLDAFEIMYKRLGTKFDNYFFESKEGRNGEPIVREFLKTGVFVESDGAIIFKGEEHGLHTRVFITSKGLPTYETKELGLNAEKFKLYPDLSESIIVTGNEQNDYFKVLMKVMSLVYPEIGAKTKHMSHGLMRFASGKMSSREGNVIWAESLIDEIKEMVMKKIEGRGFDAKEADLISDEIAIGAIKYTILRSAPGSDIIFDSASSISFEGDSGPYLQYATVRANSILEKAKQEGIKPLTVKHGAGSREHGEIPEKVSQVEKLIIRFPDVAFRARDQFAPQLIANYLITLAGEFNGLYARQTFVDKKDPLSPYYVALALSFVATMSYGLWLMGIRVPKKM